MRDGALKSLLDSIARRGAGWGHPVVMADPATGHPTTFRVSLRQALANAASGRAPRPTPREDKGYGYTTNHNGTRTILRHV